VKKFKLGERVIVNGQDGVPNGAQGEVRSGRTRFGYFDINLGPYHQNIHEDRLTPAVKQPRQRRKLHRRIHLVEDDNADL